METMTDDEAGLVRQQSFDCDGPVDIDIELTSGLVEVRLEETQQETQAPSVLVEVRHEPGTRVEWGLSGVLNWVGAQFGATVDLAEHAVRETTIAMHGQRLTVRGPRAMPLRTVPLAVTVHAPAGSAVDAQAGSADVRISGPAGRVDVDSGSGDVSVDVGGPVQVETGSGSVRLGRIESRLSARAGSGDLEVSSLSGEGNLHSGSGDVWLGSVLGGEVNVRTGSGDLTVSDAAAGQLTLVTGSGDLRVGLRSGVAAEIDVVSGSGRARSDLTVSDDPPSPEAEPALSVRGRTGSGEAVVGAATA
jgi:hypothetical protein